MHALPNPAGTDPPQLLARAQRLSLTQRRLLTLLLQLAVEQLHGRNNFAPPHDCFREALSAVLHGPRQKATPLEMVQRHLLPLRRLELEWVTPTAEGSCTDWHNMPLLCELAISRRDGEHWLQWAHPPTVLAALRDPAHWARTDLILLTRLSTHTAQALYRICAVHRHAPSARTPSQPVQWWVDALSPMPSGTTRRIWRQFKNERVRDAVDEINRETDLAIRLVEHRQGRSVVQAQFAVGNQAVASGPRDLTAPVDTTLVSRAEALGLPEPQLDALRVEFGDAAVAVQLQALEARQCAGQLLGGVARVSTLRALLRDAAMSATTTGKPTGSAD